MPTISEIWQLKISGAGLLIAIGVASELQSTGPGSGLLLFSTCTIVFIMESRLVLLMYECTRVHAIQLPACARSSVPFPFYEKYPTAFVAIMHNDEVRLSSS